MRYILAAAAVFILIFSSGCDENSGPLDPDLVDSLAGSWSGILDCTVSGGVAAPMTLAFTEKNNYWLRAVMLTAGAIYEDDFVAEVGDNLVMNFDVAGEMWELVLEGALVDSTLEGQIIRRQAGVDDIILGNWFASPS